MPARILSALLLIGLTIGPTSAILRADTTHAADTANTGRSAGVDGPLNAPFKRFIQVGPNLYRGAQPDDQGFGYLKDLGVRTIVSLRNDASERSRVESLGMRFVHIPITFRPFSTEVPADAVAQFFAVIDDPASGPVFFHCRRGADRTGTFAALYRIMRQGWNVDRAYDEARDIGMRWWYRPVKEQLRTLTQHLVVAPSLLAPAHSAR